MKKVKLFIVGLLLFTIGINNIKAETLSYEEAYNLLKKIENNPYFKVEKNDDDGFNLKVTPPADDDSGVDYGNYSFPLKYKDGIMSYIKNRDESALTEKAKAYYSLADNMAALGSLETLASKVLPDKYQSLLSNVVRDVDPTKLADYGITYVPGEKVSYSENENGVSSKIEGEDIQSFSVDTNKLYPKLVELQNTVKTIKVDNKEIEVFNLPGEVKEVKYAYDCGGNITILVLTTDLNLYALNIDGFNDSNTDLDEVFEMEKVKNDSTDKITGLTKYNIADYYQKINKQRGTCDNQNLAVKFENGKVRALEYSLVDGFSLNLSVDVLDDSVKVNEDTKPTETVKNPKTGINISYTFGIVFIIISSVSLFIVNKKKLFSK